MYTKTVSIINPTGLHARPAADFVAAAGKFESQIKISKEGSNRPAANAKSIVFVMAQGLSQNSTAVLSAEGPDEKQAVETLVSLIEGGFGEV